MYNNTIRATHVISTGPEQVPAAVHLERRNDLAHADLLAHVEVNGREKLPREPRPQTLQPPLFGAEVLVIVHWRGASVSGQKARVRPAVSNRRLECVGRQLCAREGLEVLQSLPHRHLGRLPLRERLAVRRGVLEVPLELLEISVIEIALEEAKPALNWRVDHEVAYLQRRVFFVLTHTLSTPKHANVQDHENPATTHLQEIRRVLRQISCRRVVAAHRVRKKLDRRPRHHLVRSIHDTRHVQIT
jgi:hypothetical protein